MDDKTLTALHGSIAKWQGIVAGTMQDKGPDNCPLCLLFHYMYRKERGGGCYGCPVFARTGHRCCSTTPYTDYAIARHFADSDAMALAAQAELEFLQSLLPEDSVKCRT